MPALLTRTSSWPKAATAACRAASHCAPSRTSSATASAGGPSWPASASAPARSTSARTTRCPRSAASCAVAAPMPLAAPVISTEREVIGRARALLRSSLQGREMWVLPGRGWCCRWPWRSVPRGSWRWPRSPGRVIRVRKARRRSGFRSCLPSNRVPRRTASTGSPLSRPPALAGDASDDVTVGTPDVNERSGELRRLPEIRAVSWPAGPPDHSEIVFTASISDGAPNLPLSACSHANDMGGPDYTGGLQGVGRSGLPTTTTRRGSSADPRSDGCRHRLSDQPRLCEYRGHLDRQHLQHQRERLPGMRRVRGRQAHGRRSEPAPGSGRLGRVGLQTAQPPAPSSEESSSHEAGFALGLHHIPKGGAGMGKPRRRRPATLAGTALATLGLCAAPAVANHP